jgi:hypothetical protein
MVKRLLTTAVAAALAGQAWAQAPPPAAAPDKSTAPAAAFGPPQKITENGTALVARLPSGNPFGSAVDAPPALPVKPVIPKTLLTDEMYLAIRVDAKGKPSSFRKVRDPFPSLAADVQKSISKWVFDPPKKGGQPVDAWTTVKLDLSTEVDPLKIEQISLASVTRDTPVPTPFEWQPTAAWLDAQKASPPTDGAVPVEQLDLPPPPKKNPWNADSYKRPITVKLWVHVTNAGKVDRIVPIQVADPFLIGYLKKGLSTWALRPARAGTANVESWNELTFSGSIDCSIELKQIVSLRKSL